MNNVKVIDLECLRAFKELLERENETKFADKQQFEEIVTAWQESHVATGEQVDSMLDDIFDGAGNESGSSSGNSDGQIATGEQVNSMLDDIFG